MSKSTSKPMPGTLPFRVLMRVQDLGGQASLLDLLPAMPGNRQALIQLRRIISELNDWLLVRLVEQSEVQITIVGRNHLMDFDLPTPKYVGKIVPAPTPAPFKPLDLSRMQVASGRVGALEYKDVPSMMAGERVAFSSNVKSDSTDGRS